MRVLLVEPLKHPRPVEIPHTLEAMQELVGGYISASYYWDDPVALVADDDGLAKTDRMLNRAIDEYSAIRGNFFLCGLSRDDFADLPDSLMEKYRRLFWYPEVFIPTNAGIVVLRLGEEIG